MSANQDYKHHQVVKQRNSQNGGIHIKQPRTVLGWPVLSPLPLSLPPFELAIRGFSAVSIFSCRSGLLLLLLSPMSICAQNNTGPLLNEKMLFTSRGTYLLAWHTLSSLLSFLRFSFLFPFRRYLSWQCVKRRTGDPFIARAAVAHLSTRLFLVLRLGKGKKFARKKHFSHFPFPSSPPPKKKAWE